MALESVKTCPVCGNPEFTQFLTTTDFTATGEEFTIMKCPRCGLGITTPRPTQESIGPYYQSKRYISHTGGTDSILDRIYRTVRTYSIHNKLRLINQFIPARKLLDFGCGTGDFLQAARNAGWSCTGIEPSAEARKKIAPGLIVHEVITETSDSFNAITLWHVLEHINDLNNTFSEIRKRLMPGGIIFIAVPNHESFDAKHYGPWWAGYDVPRHAWHFTKSALKQFITSHKLTLLEIKPMKFDAFYVSLLSESYKSPQSKFSNAAKALTRGLRSNVVADTDNYSSLIYIARS